MTAGTRRNGGGARVRILVVGQTGHGKSALIARLVGDVGGLPGWDRGEASEATQIPFDTAKRGYLVTDTSGHREFVGSMVTGELAADGAILVVDVDQSVQEETRRRSYLLRLLGIRQVVVAVNKMDLADDALAAYAGVAADARAYLAELNILPTHIIPVSARTGDNLAIRSTEAGRMDWYEGVPLVQALDELKRAPDPAELPLRMPVHEVGTVEGRSVVVGRVASGRLGVGDRVLFSPSTKAAAVAAIGDPATRDPMDAAGAGQSVRLTLDQDVFVERGEIISHLEAPPVLTNAFRARLLWTGRQPLEAGERYRIRLNGSEFSVQVQEIENIVEVAELAPGAADEAGRDVVAEVILRARSTMALDPFSANRATGRFDLLEEDDLAGGGIISMHGYVDQRHALVVKSTNITSVDHRVSEASRWLVNGHRGGILWLTGLSGAGKTTLALELEHALFRKGYQVYVLDGDNIRYGLSADLGFAPEDRAENIRRVGEVAALFARGGILVITAFISPYRADRDRVRAIVPDLFHEIYVKADLATCEARDPKGLYKKARAGEIADFTGISAPYEHPASAELAVDTGSQTVAESLAWLLEYIDANFSVEAEVRAESTISHS